MFPCFKEIRSLLILKVPLQVPTIKAWLFDSSMMMKDIRFD